MYTNFILNFNILLIDCMIIIFNIFMSFKDSEHNKRVFSKTYSNKLTEFKNHYNNIYMPFLVEKLVNFFELNIINIVMVLAHCSY